METPPPIKADKKPSIFTLENYVSTFPLHLQESYAKYRKALELYHQEGMSVTAIAKELNKFKATLYDWANDRFIPYVEKRIRELRFWGLYPLAPDNPHLPFIALLAGWCTGDGHLRRNLHAITFYEEYRESLESLKTSLLTRFLKLSLGKVRKQKSGTSYRLEVGNTALAHLFATLGVTAGNKTKVPFLVPRFVLNGSRDVKRYYLAGLLGSEVSTPKLGRSHSFCSIHFEMSKTESFEHEHTQFLEQIRRLLFEFGITSSDIARDHTALKPKYYFKIHSNLENIAKLAIISLLNFSAVNIER